MKRETASGFKNNIDLPSDAAQAEDWQKSNRSWWENNPMRYDWKEAIGHEEFSKEFFQEIDKRFFSDAERYMPYKKFPFDELIDFEGIANKDVLEIGVGNGSHAGILAAHSKSYTGIDLTDYAINSTSKRFKCFGLNGEIRQMDAEAMKFEDNSFDMIWSWGVIHHSSNTEKILQEMRRVLKPGGKAITMVYYRSFWNHYVMAGFFHGILQGQLFKGHSVNDIVQLEIDGAIARFYTIDEWKSLTSEYFSVGDVRIYGSKAQVFPLPAGRFKNFVMGVVPDGVSRFFTNQLRCGYFLVSTLEKPRS